MLSRLVPLALCLLALAGCGALLVGPETTDGGPAPSHVDGGVTGDAGAPTAQAAEAHGQDAGGRGEAQPAPPPRAPAKPLLFAIIGDYGTRSAGERSVRDMILKWPAELVITPGDNEQNDSLASTCTCEDHAGQSCSTHLKNLDCDVGAYFWMYMSPYGGAFKDASAKYLAADRNRFWPAIGNHDYKWKDSSGSPFYYSYFTLPGKEVYYDFVEGDVHFFALDSNPGTPVGQSPGSEQYEWLKLKLQQSTAVWKIVYFHSPPYTSGSVHGPATAMRWPIFKDCGKPGGTCHVDAVVSGDNHVYERIERDGIVYFTNGLAGGWTPYDCKAEVGGSNDPASKICLGKKTFGQTNSGAQRVTASRSGGAHELRFEMIDLGGKVWDTRTLQKSAPTTPP